MSASAESVSRFPPYVTLGGKIGHYALAAFGIGALLFLMAPVLVIVPLAFNADPFFTYPIHQFSLVWFRHFFGEEVWRIAVKNSFVIAISATLIATSLGTLASVGLSHRNLPGRSLITAVLVSPMIVPIVIVAVGAYFFYSTLGIANSLVGIILAHAALGTPFVVITVTATLAGFDQALFRAARSLGASPWTAFRRITLPIIWPGVFSGALFAFATSFDEVVVVLFLGSVEQRTIPRQMWTGLREQMSPTILAAAVVLIVISVLMLLTLEALRRRSMKLRGLKD
ncbi:MAG: ABC transporter permease [Burkholderiales bacterium]|nr:ABC transporter permease [Burkholderiales bacterium]MDE2457361.1 ABC transporter permease [Burkholderiales bacterium]